MQSFKFNKSAVPSHRKNDYAHANDGNAKFPVHRTVHTAQFHTQLLYYNIHTQYRFRPPTGASVYRQNKVVVHSTTDRRRPGAGSTRECITAAAVTAIEMLYLQ